MADPRGDALRVLDELVASWTTTGWMRAGVIVTRRATTAPFHLTLLVAPPTRWDETRVMDAFSVTSTSFRRGTVAMTAGTLAAHLATLDLSSLRDDFLRLEAEDIALTETTELVVLSSTDRARAIGALEAGDAAVDVPFPPTRRMHRTSARLVGIPVEIETPTAGVLRIHRPPSLHAVRWHGVVASARQAILK